MRYMGHSSCSSEVQPTPSVLSPLAIRQLSAMTQSLRLYTKRLRQKRYDVTIKWIDITEVVAALVTYGHVIHLHAHRFNTASCLYHIDGRVMPATHLVYLLNYYRFQEQKAPFYVKGITLCR